MQRVGLWSLAVCGLLASSGCSVSPSIIRGQSPMNHAGVQQTSFGYHEPFHEHLRQKMQGQQSSFHTVSPMFAGHGCRGGMCPPGGGCPQGMCPPGGGCPGGMCGGGGCGMGNGNDHVPHHGYSYSYHMPNNLVYPPANVPGGAVVYPYYTHRGPSDFFRDEPRR